MKKPVFAAVVVVAVSMLAIASIWHHYSRKSDAISPPTIHEIRELAQLMLIRLQVSQVCESSLRGYLGGNSATLSARAEVVIGVDLELAHYEQIDHEKQCVVLSIPRPRVQYVVVDHKHCRLKFSRKGLWVVATGNAGEDVLTERVFAVAVDSFENMNAVRQHRASAERRAEFVLGGFLSQLGWTAQVRWEERQVSE